MRIPLNLASRPYENLRPYYAVAFIAGCALLVLSALLLLKQRQIQHDTRFQTEQASRLENDLQNLRLEQNELDQWLARPDAQEVRTQAAFLNSLILRKSLSWTQMFLDLEKILPSQAQVTAIHPGLNEAQQPELKLTITSGEMGPLVEFLKNAEGSAQFGSPVVLSQRFVTDRSNGAGRVMVEAVLPYHQTLPSVSQRSAADAARHDPGDAAARPSFSARARKGETE